MEELNKKIEDGKIAGKELYELKKKQKEEARKKEQRKETLAEAPKKIGRYLLYVLVGIGLIGGLDWYIATRPPIIESEIASRKGMHWHPELAIYVKGVKQKFPANLAGGASPINTHEANGIIHLESQGLVLKNEILLGQFFKIWGKDIRSFGANMKMTVNGQENVDYENYVMRDKDKIELNFE